MASDGLGKLSSMPKLEVDFEAIQRLGPGEREAALAKVNEAVELLRENPLHGYNPYGKQAELHGAAGSYGRRAFFGGNRVGKTTAGIVDDLLEVVPRELIPPHLRRWKLPQWECPRYIRVGNVSGREIRTIIVPKLQEYVPRALLPDSKDPWRSAYNRDDGMLRLECGCYVQTLSYEVEREKWGGSPLHRVHFDEEPPRELYDEGAARLIDFDGTELFTMTPLLGMTWMFDDIWLRAGKPGSDVFAVTASMLDNPHISKEGIATAIDKWRAFPEMLAARVFGRFVHFGGLVFPAWAQYRRDWVDAEYIRGCEIVVGIDPGARFFGLSWNAFDDAGNQVQFASALIAGDHHESMPAEFRLEGANVEDAARKIREINAKWGLSQHAIEYVIDPAARARSAITSATVETEFNNLGIYPVHAQTDREAGVMLLRRKGKYGAFVTVDMEGNEAAQWEAERYRISDRADGKFDVVKEFDHVMDATRYASMHRPWDPPPVADIEDLVKRYRRPENRGEGVAVPPLRPTPPTPPEGAFV